MTEKLTDESVADLLALMRSEVQVDTKVNEVTRAKSAIKQFNVPETCALDLLEALRIASTSPHSALANAGFTALNHLFTRLSRQESKHLAKDASRSLPIVIEKLGDPKEKFRTLANQSLITLYGAAPMDVERFVRNTAMVGKNVRAKELSMNWLLFMHREQGVPFRSYVPSLMDLLEDADASVRETAKVTVIELFKNAPNTAKSDLKRQLKNFNVRAAIEQAIVRALIPAGTAAARPETPSDARPSFAAPPTERPSTPVVIDTNAEALEPTYVNTARELEDIFREMAMYFDGRETEQNWLKREQSMTKLRKLMVGNVPQQFAEPFLLNMKGLLDGIVKAITSLRTSLSKEGCAVVKDAANTFGPGIDPLVEILLQTLIKLCAATKKIASQQANSTVEVIISRATYSNRIMQHIWGAAQDKNVQPRLYATSWLKIVLNQETRHKAQLEHSGGLDLIEKCLKKGLNDANPGVRQQSRSTYWIFYGTWKAKAEAIMDSLDATAQKLLNRDPGNPNADAASAPSKAGGTIGRGASAKPSLRETMMAQKKAAMAAAKENAGSRPGSAMSQAPPARPSVVASHSSSTNVAPMSAPPNRIRPGTGSTAVGGSTLSAAPVRPRRKAPAADVSRPATAGPYSSRNQEPAMEIVTPEPPFRTAKHNSMAQHARDPSPTRHYQSDPMQCSPAPPYRSPTRSPTRQGFHSPTRAGASRPTTPKASPTRGRGAMAASHGPMLPPSKVQGNTDPFRNSSPARIQPHFDLEMTMDLDSPARVLQQHQQRYQQAPLQDITAPNVMQLARDTQEMNLSEQAKAHHSEDITMNDVPVSAPAPASVSAPTEMARGPENTPVFEANSASSNASGVPDAAAEQARVNGRLLDSGITRVQTKTLDVHGFRKLQSFIRGCSSIPDQKFKMLLLGLFDYLEGELPNLTPDKAQDIKVQALATVKILLRDHRAAFQPYVARGLAAIMTTRAASDARAHLVSGLELVAEELVVLGNATELIYTVVQMQQKQVDATGLHVIAGILQRHTGYVPTDQELAQLVDLIVKCLESENSSVRRGAVEVCVVLHSRVGEERFWSGMKGMKDDPKSLLTYYIVKRQRDQAV